MSDKSVTQENMESTIEYLSAKVKVYESNLNKGEKDEILLMIELFHLNQIKKISLKLRFVVLTKNILRVNPHIINFCLVKIYI